MSDFIYKLNAMEHASQADHPDKMGYAGKRKAVLDHVAGVESELAAAQAKLARIEAAERELPEEPAEPIHHPAFERYAAELRTFAIAQKAELDELKSKKLS